MGYYTVNASTIMITNLNGAILPIQFPSRKCRQRLVGLRDSPDRFIHLAAQKENTSQQFAAEKIVKGVGFSITALVADNGNPMTRSSNDGFPE